MKNILLLNGAKSFGHSGGKLNDTLHEVAEESRNGQCRTDFADIQNKKECGGNRQWQNHYLRNWAANTKGKGII